MTYRLFLASMILTAFTLSACTEDSGEQNNPMKDMEDMSKMDDSGPLCVDGEEYDSVMGKCLPIFANNSKNDMESGDMMQDTSQNNMQGDMSDDMMNTNCLDTTLYIDEDEDGVGIDDPATNKTMCITADQIVPGFASKAGDCDDKDRYRSPDRIELCDEIDNDCDNNINNGVVCEFYAQTADDLYLVDPFKKKAVKLTEVPGLFDMDTHPDGRLFGITSKTLYRFDANTKTWFEVGDLRTSGTEDANGFAIDRTGKAYATSQNKLFKVNLDTGKADLVGTMDNDVYSSGDCVINKNNLLMTSKSMNNPDDLVQLNGDTAKSTILGSTGFSRIYGLTTAWGKLYGLNADGELILLDTRTGQGTLVHKFEGIRWYGAASTPADDR